MARYIACLQEKHQCMSMHICSTKIRTHNFTVILKQPKNSVKHYIQQVMTIDNIWRCRFHHHVHLSRDCWSAHPCWSIWEPRCLHHAGSLQSYLGKHCSLQSQPCVHSFHHARSLQINIGNHCSLQSRPFVCAKLSQGSFHQHCCWRWRYEGCILPAISESVLVPPRWALDKLPQWCSVIMVGGFVYAWLPQASFVCEPHTHFFGLYSKLPWYTDPRHPSILVVRAMHLGMDYCVLTERKLVPKHFPTKAFAFAMLRGRARPGWCHKWQHIWSWFGRRAGPEVNCYMR